MELLNSLRGYEMYTAPLCADSVMHLRFKVRFTTPCYATCNTIPTFRNGLLSADSYGILLFFNIVF